MPSRRADRQRGARCPAGRRRRPPARPASKPALDHRPGRLGGVAVPPAVRVQVPADLDLADPVGQRLEQHRAGDARPSAHSIAQQPYRASSACTVRPAGDQLVRRDRRRAAQPAGRSRRGRRGRSAGRGRPADVVHARSRSRAVHSTSTAGALPRRATPGPRRPRRTPPSVGAAGSDRQVGRRRRAASWRRAPRPRTGSCSRSAHHACPLSGSVAIGS